MLRDATAGADVMPPPRLGPFAFWLASPKAEGGPQAPPDPQTLRAAIGEHLAAQGWRGAEPLRWAITAVDPGLGWRLEGVAIGGGDPPRP